LAIVAVIAMNSGLNLRGKRTCGKAPWVNEVLHCFEVRMFVVREDELKGFKTTTKKSR
jgi:hypothetical protein